MKKILLVIMAWCALMLLPVGTAAADTPVRATDVTTAASGNTLVLVDGTYIYMSKEDILGRINQIRQEACDQGVPDPRVQNAPRPALTPSDYVPVKWSSDLEWIAQLRAAEATVHLAHERPNGTMCFTAQHNGVQTFGENIAWNYSGDILGGINQWYGEKTDWVNQNASAVTGHYESLINPRNRQIGIGAFCPDDGYGAVAGEFTSYSDLDEAQTGTKGACRQIVEVKTANLKVDALKALAINVSAQKNVRLTGKTSYENGLGAGWSPREAGVTAYGVKWSSANTGVASVNSAGTVKGVAAGTTTITGTYNGNSYKMTVTVTKPKANNPLSVAAKTASVKYKKLKKKAQTLAVSKVIKTKKKGAGTVKYTLSSAKKGKKSFKKYFTINAKTGKLKIKKGLKKGTYKVQIKVSAAGNAQYKAATKTVTAKIKVK